MNKDSEKFLNELQANYNNILEIMKIEDDGKKIKAFEKELNKTNNLIRALTSYINYYKLKNLKSKE